MGSNGPFGVTASSSINLPAPPAQPAHRSGSIVSGSFLEAAFGACGSKTCTTLSAEKLAALVMGLVQGSAALQRRARMELSAVQGPKEVASDLRKRFASLRLATSFVDWRKQKALVKELEGLLAMIENTIAHHDPNEAFELLCSFLHLAPSVHERTDDSNGPIGGVMSEAVDLIAKLSPTVSQDRTALAERVLDAVADAGYGEFDGIIPATAEALGQEGFEHLKQIMQVWAVTPPTEQELEQYRDYSLMSSAEDSVRRNRQVTRSTILADAADAQGMWMPAWHSLPKNS